MQPFDAQRVKKLAAVLALSSRVTRHDTPSEPGAWATAIGLADIDESCEVLMAKLLPRLLECRTSEQVDELLLDIEDELRHILYHVGDLKIYGHLLEESQNATGDEN